MNQLITGVKADGRLRGWIVAIGFFVILSPVIISFQMYSVFSKIYLDGLWFSLWHTSVYEHGQLWKLILVGELVVNGLVVFAWLHLNYLFFLKKLVFKKLFIGMLIFTPTFLLIDALIIKIVINGSINIGHDAFENFIKSLPISATLISYMLMSKRVKETFVE